VRWPLTQEIGVQFLAGCNSSGLPAHAIGMVNGALKRYSISAGRIHKAITFTALTPEKKPKLLIAIPLAQVCKFKALKH